MHHAVTFLLFLFSCEEFAMDHCQKSDIKGVVVCSRTSDRSTAHQSLYILGLLKRFQWFQGWMKCQLQPQHQQRCRRLCQVVRHKPHLSCSVLEWRPECSYKQNQGLLLSTPSQEAFPLPRCTILSSLGSMMGFSGF